MRSEVRAETGIDPLTPLNELLHVITHAVVTLSIGLALGIVCARTLRRLGLHWSWAAFVFALAVAVRPGSTETRAVIGAAALAAALCGRRWHREDLDAGLDLAEAALLRRVPRDALNVAGSLALARCSDLVRKSCAAGQGHRSRASSTSAQTNAAGRRASASAAAGVGRTR